MGKGNGLYFRFQADIMQCMDFMAGFEHCTIIGKRELLLMVSEVLERYEPLKQKDSVFVAVATTLKSIKKRCLLLVENNSFNPPAINFINATLENALSILHTSNEKGDLKK